MRVDKQSPYSQQVRSMRVDKQRPYQKTGRKARRQFFFALTLQLSSSTMAPSSTSSSESSRFWTSTKIARSEWRSPRHWWLLWQVNWVPSQFQKRIGRWSRYFRQLFSHPVQHVGQTVARNNSLLGTQRCVLANVLLDSL